MTATPTTRPTEASISQPPRTPTASTPSSPPHLPAELLHQIFTHLLLTTHDLHLQRSIYDIFPQRHFAFPPPQVCTFGFQARRLATVCPLFKAIVLDILYKDLPRRTAAYGEGWEAVCIEDLPERTLCGCKDDGDEGRGRRKKRGKLGPVTFTSKRKFLTNSRVVIEYHQCVDCNTLRREIMALQRLIKDVEVDELARLSRNNIVRGSGIAIGCIGCASVEGCLTIRRKDSGVDVDVALEKPAGVRDDGCRKCADKSTIARKVPSGGRYYRKPR
jgi:hypothetical protein